MIEIRIHGRGGQGNVVAAYLLATAAIEEGRFGQAFPAFGAERRGAPVVAFTRIGDRPIRRRCQVREPAFLIVQDQALLQVPGVTDGLKAGGKILVNSSRPSEALSAEIGRDIVSLPATHLATQILGRPVPNTALLSAFLTLTGIVPREALLRSLGQRFKGPVLERNTQLVEAAAQQVEPGSWKEATHATST
ncbi:MAG: 2-oxoacid:acceptor oxidoreductase family protein [Gammaproteobacteria bacterium]|jgi:pyruvate ferredoxin oxidoreductase gamma subunit|nr:2-oxoacid:acceptor oxidoreductase family protein [Gammaproteobacteria bacterium]